MNCKQAQQDLQLYVDGRLHQRRFSLVEAHLDMCLDCQHTLALYEIMRAALQDPALEREPSNLTALIMARIAMAEQRKVMQSAHPFAWRWGDAVLAALLGTASTALFLLINPTVRTSAFLTIGHNFPMLATLTQAEGPGSIPWIAWLIWITVGVGLTLWLAGPEMRAAWRHSLTQRLQTRPGLRQLW
jgi:hypothetical protein